MSKAAFRWSLLLLLVIAAGGALLLAWIFYPSLFPPPAQAIADSALDDSTPGTGSSPVPIDVTTVERGDLSLGSEATGHLKPWRMAELSADAGGQVLERRIEEGEWVEEGEILLELDSLQVEIELEEARAELLKARAGFAVEYGVQQPAGAERNAPELEKARREHQENQELFDSGLLPRKDLERSRQRLEALSLLTGEQRQDVQAATSGLAQAEQRLERAKLALARTRVRAPFAGRVADLSVEVGQRIAPGEICMTLQDDSRLKVQVAVLEEDVVRLQEGASVEVRIPSLDDLVLAGRIHSINPRIEPASGTGRITVALPNQRDRLLPGLFTYVQIETRRLEDRIVVPTDAILERDGREVVFKVVDGRARWTYVATGARTRHRVEILSGVDVGDVLAIGGHFTLSHNTPVTIRTRREG